MQSLRFEEGYKEFMINDDPNRVIRFNPADPNLLHRLFEVQENLEKKPDVLSDLKLKPDGNPYEEAEEVSKALGEYNTILREQINYLFDNDVYDTVFRGQSPLCIVGTKKKQFLIEAFINAVAPILKKEITQYHEESVKRIDKYTERYHK